MRPLGRHSHGCCALLTWGKGDSPVSTDGGTSWALAPLHGITEWLRLAWTPVQSHIQQACQGHVQLGSKYLQGWRHLNISKAGDTMTSLSNLCQCSTTFIVKNKKYYPREFPVFQFVPIISCPVTGHYWEEPVFNYPIRYLSTWKRSPWTIRSSGWPVTAQPFLLWDMFW